MAYFVYNLLAFLCIQKTAELFGPRFFVATRIYAGKMTMAGQNGGTIKENLLI